MNEEISNYKEIIEKAYLNINSSLLKTSELAKVTYKVLEALEQGIVRAAEKIDESNWQCNEWVKKAILLFFKLHESEVVRADFTNFFDKVPLRFKEYSFNDFQNLNTRIVPGAIVRKGAFIGQNTILMPSFVNTGAYVGSNSMIDTWATVGSCAQIGNKVHISGGAGIGGVLEPLQATPTIIEDDCFIGARSEIVEGVVISKGSVIAMGVFIGKSTKIYNPKTDEVSYGIVPPYSVVIPGSLPSVNGKYSTSAAIIIKQVDEKTRARVSINELLRS